MSSPKSASMFEEFKYSVTKNINNIKFDTRLLGIVLAVLSIIATAVYAYVTYVRPDLNPFYQENSELLASNDSATKMAKLTMYHVDWCPHCKKAIPIWEDAKEKIKNRVVNNVEVVLDDVNCTSETPEIKEILARHSIEGYPTILLHKPNGETAHFDSKPDVNLLSDFVDDALR